MWFAAFAGLLLASVTASSQTVPPLKPPTVTDPIVGLDLWRGAEVGMSIEQVQRLFPGATEPTNPTTLTGGEADGLQLSGVDLDRYPAIAHFYFKDARLVSVELTLRDLPPAQSRANLADAERIAATLSGRYGAGYDCGDKSFSDIAAFECKWLRKPLSIRLWYMDTAGQAPLFYLAYRQADDPGYDL